MPPLLNDLESQYYFDNLLFVAHSSTLSLREKLQQLNTTFLSIVNVLTEHREKQIFTGWFAKINFICQAYNLSSQQEEELQSLRRLLRRISVRGKFEPNAGHLWATLKILSELVAFFSDNPVPDVLASLYADKILSKIYYKEPSKDILEELYAVIISKSELSKDTQGQHQIQLVCESDLYGIIRITITDTHYYNPHTGELFRKHEISKQCATLVRKHQTVCLTYLEKLEENHFASTAQTLLIVSPDYLIDATTISKCFDVPKPTPYLYLLDRLKFFQGNEHTFIGKLINDMLDNWVETGEENFEISFQKVLAESQTDALLIDLQEDTLRNIQHILKPQFDTICQVMQHYKTHQITTEPTFISGKFGLQGRIDLLIEYVDNPIRKDIIELKSTNYTNLAYSPARKDHLVQVACYNLLTESTYLERKGVSAILYSKDSFTPLRDCGKLNFEEQDAMWIRNCIVYIDWQLAKGEINFFDNVLQRLNHSDLPHYKQEDVVRFAQKWQNANELEKAYFADLMGLVAREMIIAKVGGMSGNELSQGFASLWQSTLAEKTDSFSILSHLTIQKINPSKSEITFKRSEISTASAFRKGDIIVLYPIENEEELQPQRYPLLKGNILELTSDTLQIKIWNKSVDSHYFEKYADWAIEPNLMENNFTAQFASLATFLGEDKHKKELLLGLKKPTFNTKFTVDYTHILSPEQNQILCQALSAEDYFLLQGPPGTGKTSKMLRSMVDFLYHHTEQTIVLLAFTNRATDEICQKIESVCEGAYIRLGNMQENNEYREKSLKSVKALSEMRQKIQHTRIFVSTVSSFYGSAHLIPRFDTIIVDEASQLLEPSLCRILPKFKRFILIGDEKQLPAVVTQPSYFCKSNHPLLKNIGLEDLSISVFERLLQNAQQKGWSDTYNMLSIQYRTHQDIAQFISQEFYKTLKIGSPTQQEEWQIFDSNSENTTERLLAQSRLLYIPSQKEEHLKYHTQEAKTVAQLLQTIRQVFTQKASFTSNTVGVITPYRAQIAEIMQYLDDELLEKVTIDTVERFQGSERDIIIVSMAVNHLAQMKNLQSFNTHYSVDKKLNVVLSRAKEQLILIGNPEILKEGLFYKKLIDHIESPKNNLLFF